MKTDDLIALYKKVKETLLAIDDPMVRLLEPVLDSIVAVIGKVGALEAKIESMDQDLRCLGVAVILIAEKQGISKDPEIDCAFRAYGGDPEAYEKLSRLVHRKAEQEESQ